MKKNCNKLLLQWGVILLIFSLITPTNIMATTIYMFVDKNGTRHFSDTPTSPKSRIFIKGKAKRYKAPLNKKCYDHLIKKAARKFKVDFSLIKAVIEVESAYNPRAISSKGARGLMQIMPFNFTSLNLSDPFEPSQNIMAGTRYLHQLLHQYRGNIKHALAAYNAGPGNVDKYNGVPPFQETRNYVQKVMALHRIYRPNS
ncbi:soluble lytic murein transglycosylase [Desulfocicer vacuolatum DSM 3385]|uniref:Soluble lytic murein transglycosylase n=1 Tax=Desulfocicer vacuolatum DSM 3385 TaxID=1121400 RepID=A0A1W2A670_9BACT|nr:lytic transglycosylase domain-containing protein [Desulfocicer vacuolatum]SMC55952.1 soluble lytic murein transglycosylase [Desulfocicer vacuolatum DSM 3385]